MNYRVVLYAQAKADIKRNARWWAEHHSVVQAFDWFDAVNIQIDTLANFPGRCVTAAESNRFPYEVRQLSVGVGTRKSYRAVFTIRENEVHVLAVCRGDQAPLQPGDLPTELDSDQLTHDEIGGSCFK